MGGEEMDERDDLDARLAELTGFHSVDTARCPDEARWVDFARGALPATEAERLRDHLSRCPRCVEAARDARRFLAALGELEERPAASARRRRFARIAATVLVAAGLTLVLELRRDAPDPLSRWTSGTLAAPDPLPGSVDDELVFRGDSDGPATAAAELARGFELLAGGHPGAARSHLATAAAAPDPALAAEARWYLAIACLRAGDRAAAAAVLAPLRGRPGPRTAEVEALAEALADPR